MKMTALEQDCHHFHHFFQINSFLFRYTSRRNSNQRTTHGKILGYDIWQNGWKYLRTQKCNLVLMSFQFGFTASTPRRELHI